jgi:flagellar hook-basal body complex protein FliE
MTIEATTTSIGLVEPKQPNTAANFEDLMARMTQAINHNQTQTPAVVQDITATQIGFKLDGTNYALWS